MRTYTVHAKFTDPAAIAARAAEVVFVKDGFCWPAFFFTAIWFLARGMWLVLASYLVLMIAVGVALEKFDAAQPTGFVVALAVGLLAGMEGNDLRRWTLARRGLRLVGIVQARSLAEAEQRFFEQLVAADPRAVRAAQAAAAPARSPAAPRRTWSAGVRPRADDDDDEIVGLFPRPGGNS